MIIDRIIWFLCGGMVECVLMMLYKKRSSILNHCRKAKKHKQKRSISEKGINISPLIDNPYSWYMEEKYIAHALGGIGGFPYTNSKEAFFQALENGFKIVEADVCLTNDGKFVLSHEFSNNQEQKFIRIPPSFNDFCNAKINYRYTPMTLDEMLVFIRHKDIYLFIDSKEETLSFLLEYLVSLDYIDEISNKLIFQVVTKEECMMVELKGKFKNIHFNLPSGILPLEIVPFLIEHQIHTVSMWKGQMVNKEMVETLKAANIKIFVYSLNRISEMKDAVQAGAWGCFTDFLVSEELKFYCDEVI